MGRWTAAVLAACVSLGALAFAGDRQAVALPTPVPTWRVAVETNDIVYDATRELIWASVRSGTPGANSIMAIDPWSLEVSSPFHVGEDPHQLAISSDGSRLYVGLDGIGAVTSVDLTSMTLAPPTLLPNGIDGRLDAGDLAVIPGNASQVAVVLIDGRISRPYAGVVVLHDGVPQPDVLPTSAHNTHIAFGSATTLYGYDSDMYSSVVTRNSVTATGLREDSRVSGVLDGRYGSLMFENGRLYTSDGQVADPQAGVALGRISIPPQGGSRVAPVPGSDQVYLLVSDPHRQALLRRYDGRNLRLVDEWSTSLPAPDFLDRPGSLLVLGGGDVAYRANDAVYLMSPDSIRRSAGEFTALSPTRVLDTRAGIGAAPVPLGGGDSIDVQITGVGGVPVSGVDSVVMNVTAADPSAGGYLTVFPTGSPVPNISSVNFGPGSTVPNLVTIPVGRGGRVSVFNAFGSTHVLFDVAGFYSTASGPGGSRFTPTSPTRVIDTRLGLGLGHALTSSVESFRILGTAGVPEQGVTAVALNVTVARPTADGYLTVFPADASMPVVSNLNFVVGQTVPNLVIVRVPGTGVIGLSNFTGSVDVIVDVVGYYGAPSENSQAGRFVSFDPERIFDSRFDSPYPPPGAIEADSTLIIGDDVGQYAAWVLNLTATATTASGFVTVFPYPASGDWPADPPSASNLNYEAGRDVANAVIARTGPRLGFFNAGGDAHLIVDVFGAFTS